MLYGWKLQSVVGDQWFEKFPWGFALGADTWLRVHSGPDAKEEMPQHILWTNGYIWNDSGDGARLFDNADRLVDAWSY